MVYVMVQKTVCRVIRIVDSVRQNHPVGMEHVMVLKIVGLVLKIVALVTHFHQLVATANAMAMRIVRIVLKIVVPI